MSKYTTLCEEIIKNLGGKENIHDAAHCMTRLRLHVNDAALVDEKALEQVDGVQKLVKQGGQHQIVIGQHVADVYAEFVKLAGVSAEAAIDENLDKGNVSVMAKIFDFISGIMFQFIMVLVGCAVVQAVNIICMNIGLYTNASGIYKILNAIGNTVLYFMPIVMGYAAAKKLSIDPVIGMAIGAAMMHPNISNVDIELFGMTFNNNYSSTMLPVVLTVLFAYPIERFFRKHLPTVVKQFLTPAFTLAIAVPVGFCVVGPIANWIGNFLGGGLNSLIALSPAIGGAIIGGLYEVFVVFGLHNAISVPSITNILSGVPDSFGAMRAGCCFACATAALAVYLRSKDKKMKDVALPAFVSGMFGVTEPALYGIMVQKLRVFAAVCIAGAVGGAIAGILGAMAYMPASGGVFQFVGYIDPNNATGSLIAILSSFAANAIIAFVVTWFLYKDEDSDIMARQKKLL